jgi:hypothetical protein
MLRNWWPASTGIRSAGRNLADARAHFKRQHRELDRREGAPSKRGPAPLLQQKIERLTRLPKAKQKIVMEMLDGVLAQASR